MKTSLVVSSVAFAEWWDAYMRDKSYTEQLEDLLLIFENSDSRYYLNFMASRRVKAHSAAFYSVVLAVKPFLPTGYYTTNQQIKKLIEKYSGLDYRDYLAPLVKEIERLRDEMLNEKFNSSQN